MLFDTSYGLEKSNWAGNLHKTLLCFNKTLPRFDLASPSFLHKRDKKLVKRQRHNSHISDFNYETYCPLE